MYKHKLDDFMIITSFSNYDCTIKYSIFGAFKIVFVNFDQRRPIEHNKFHWNCEASAVVAFNTKSDPIQL